MKYYPSMFLKIFFVVLVLGAIIANYLMISKHDIRNLLWATPGLILLAIITLGIWQTYIVIDDNKIEQWFPPNPFFKTKLIAWEDVDYVVKDGLDDLSICRLLSKGPNKTKMINISGIKNMDLLIIEIVKRAKNAEIDPAFRELAKKESKK